MFFKKVPVLFSSHKYSVHFFIDWPINSLNPFLTDHSCGGSNDNGDIFRRQHPVVWQRQRSPADFNPRHQRQYSDPPKAVVQPTAEPPGSRRLGFTPRSRSEHCPGSAVSVKLPTLWTRISISHKTAGGGTLLAKKYLCVTIFRSVHNFL